MTNEINQLSELEEKTKLLVEDKLKNLYEWEENKEYRLLRGATIITHKTLPITVMRVMNSFQSGRGIAYGIGYATFKNIRLDVKLVDAVLAHIELNEQKQKEMAREKELKDLLLLTNWEGTNDC